MDSRGNALEKVLLVIHKIICAFALKGVVYVKIIHITADARAKTHRRTYVDQCRALERAGSFGRRFGGGPSTCS